MEIQHSSVMSNWMVKEGKYVGLLLVRIYELIV